MGLIKSVEHLDLLPTIMKQKLPLIHQPQRMHMLHYTKAVLRKYLKWPTIMMQQQFLAMKMIPLTLVMA
ncbi:MAG: hypothetical protein CMN96_03795 [Synechococcus sp. MED850]|nr:hypothetical protein [Synechococcus sp. MED850]OUW98384.1 MAG: hypothetical protein CBD89_02520 [Cyanobacteria bacterium TMED229]